MRAGAGKSESMAAQVEPGGRSEALSWRMNWEIRQAMLQAADSDLSLKDEALGSDEFGSQQRQTYTFYVRPMKLFTSRTASIKLDFLSMLVSLLYHGFANYFSI